MSGPLRDTLMAARAPREAEERTAGRRRPSAPLLSAGTDMPAAREVLLVTYDIDRRALVLRTRRSAGDT